MSRPQVCEVPKCEEPDTDTWPPKKMMAHVTAIGEDEFMNPIDVDEMIEIESGANLFEWLGEKTVGGQEIKPSLVCDTAGENLVADLTIEEGGFPVWAASENKPAFDQLNPAKTGIIIIFAYMGMGEGTFDANE